MTFFHFLRYKNDVLFALEWFAMEWIFALMGRKRPRQHVSTALLYESQLILNKVISSKPMKDMKNPKGTPTNT